MSRPKSTENPWFADIRRRFPPAQSRVWHTHDNGGRPFCVWARFPTLAGQRPRTSPADAPPLEVAVFRQPDATLANLIDADDGDDETWTYVVPVTTQHTPSRLWVGESPENAMTRFSGGAGPAFRGNSILVQCETAVPTRCLWIGMRVCEFDLVDGDSIVDFVSPVGNNDVPYPVVLGRTHVYFPAEGRFVARSAIPWNDVDEDRGEIAQRANDAWYGHGGQTTADDAERRPLHHLVTVCARL